MTRVILGLLLLLSAGCRSPHPSDIGDPEDLVTVGPTRVEILAGRQFHLTQLSSILQGRRGYSLEIIGDDVVVCFSATTAPPHLPSVAGDTVEFGGHTFEITRLRNNFVADGRPHDLEPGGHYLFNEGVYVTRLR